MLMNALRYVEIGKPPVVVDIPIPKPGPGQVLLKITAGGVCHSDDYVMGLSEKDYHEQGYPLPLTLGHEGAAAEGIRPPGLGSQGSMAEYMIVDDARHLVPLGDLDPVQNVSLTDAGLTPYHAIKNSLPKLGAGTVAVVIGTGGLGHVGIQILKAISGATVIALDVNDEKLKLATEVGADHVLISDASAAEKIRELTGGLGANAVFDFVGANPTIALAQSVAALEADITIVGIGGGSMTLGFGSIAYDAAVRIPYWGSRAELIEVLDLARAGKIHVQTESYTLDDGPKAYEDLASNSIRGRAVIVP